MIKLKYVLLMLVCSVGLGSLGTSAEAREMEPETEALRGPAPQVLTLQVRAGGENAIVRVLEGRGATVTNRETGEQLALTASRQPSGDFVLEVVDLGRESDPWDGQLISILPLRNGRSQTLQSPRRQELEFKLLPRQTGQLKATSSLVEPDDSDGAGLMGIDCCVTCGDWVFCGCGVDTSCGSCCRGICCDFM